MLSLVLLSIIVISKQDPSIAFQEGMVLMTGVTYAVFDQGYSASPVELEMDVAFPTKSSGPLPAVIFVDNGVWSTTEESGMETTIHILAKGGYLAIRINFRLAVQDGFPAAVHQCKAAIRFLRSNAEELNIDPNRIGILGFSTGGYLATLVGMSADVRRLDGQINGRNVSMAVTCIGSVSGIVMPKLAEGEVKRLYEQWIGGHSSILTTRASPQTYLDSKDPPIYLLCGKNDVIAPVKHTQMFVKSLKENGIEHHLEVVQGSGHTLQDPASYLGVLHFLDTHLGGRAKEALKLSILELARGD